MIIAELVTIFALLFGGAFLVRAAGLQGWGLPALAFIAGIAFMVIIGSLQVISRWPANPVSTLILALLIPMGIWLWRYNKGAASFFPVLPSILFSAAAAAAAAGLHAAKLLNLSPDSYRYAQLGSLFESGNMAYAQPTLLLKRLLGVPLLHAPANLADHFFLASITPLLSLATVAILAWYCQKGLQTVHDSLFANWLLPSAAALLLLSNQFFIYNAFYVNGHVLYAAFLLLLAGSGWLYACNADVPRTALATLMICAVPAMIFTRPEAGLHVGLALLPVLISTRFPLQLKALLLAALGGSVITWNGFLWLKFIAAGQSAPVSVSGMFGLGLCAVMAIPLLFTRIPDCLSLRLLLPLEILLWAGVAVAALLDPTLFTISITATIKNILLGQGAWGFSLIILGVLVVGILILTDSPHRIFLRFPLTTFIPLALLLAHLREIPYRIGMLDSLNRMFVHILPLAILFIASAATKKQMIYQKR